MNSDLQNGKKLIKTYIIPHFVRLTKNKIVTSHLNWSLCHSLHRNARLQLTDELIGELGDISASQDAEEDMQRIQELLSLPHNEADSQDTSHQ